MAVTMYGLLLAIPVVIAIAFVSTVTLGPVTLLLPLSVFLFATYLLPVGFGNPYVTKLVRRHCPSAGKSAESFVSQVRVQPSLRSGLGSLLEDADDFGCLSITASELIFEGDRLKLRLPYEHIASAELKNIGLRGLFIYGPRIVIRTAKFPEAEMLEFGERSSITLNGSQSIARNAFKKLSGHLKSAKSGSVAG